MITGLISSMFEKMSDVAIEQWSQHQSFINTRLVVRDRLRREARLNAELLEKRKDKNLTIHEISTCALQEVFEMPVPLNKLLDKNLDEASRKILRSNKNYKLWTRNIIDESELVERLWHRTRMLEIHIKNNTSRPNLNYLCILNRALAESLKKC